MLTRSSLATGTVSRIRSLYSENTEDAEDAENTDGRMLHRHQQPLHGPRRP
ncbi:hypothetical protein [Streptomyces canus]|uniref:hypothetical protein n=1 Tax=Streptomyces canus TaxID=58343 RepID=UPI000370F3C2|nr:hypothetical protein [Streptomyces canus]